MAIVGGAKVSTKIDVLTNLVARMDVLVVGGGMANTFLLAKDVNIGASFSEPDFVPTARDIMARANQAGCEIVLPTDAVVAKELKRVSIGASARWARAAGNHDPRFRA